MSNYRLFAMITPAQLDRIRAEQVLEVRLTSSQPCDEYELTFESPTPAALRLVRQYIEELGIEYKIQHRPPTPQWEDISA